MYFLAVAPITIRRSMGEGRNLADLMPQGRMAAGAFDLVVSHMFFMHHLGGEFRTQEDRFIMTFQALSLRDMAISLDNAEMALLASDPSGDIFLMIKAPPFDPDIPLRLHVAGGTSSDGAGKTFFLSLGAGLVVVADETIDFMDRQVFPLDELSMTAGTAELHPPPQLP